MSAHAVRTKWIWPLLLSVMIASVHAGAAPTPDDVLERAAAFMGPKQPVRYQCEVTSYRGNSATGSAKLSVWIGNFGAAGVASPQTLIVFQQPPRLRGRVILYEGDRLWIYFPGTSQPIRVPPLQQLFGQADIGAVLNIDYRRTYRASFAEVDAPADQILLDLKAKQDGAIYDHVRLWVDRSSSAPLRAEYFTISGKQLKSTRFGPLIPLAGAQRYRDVDITDSGDDVNHTVIRYVDAAPEALPAYKFRPEYLKNL
jgi:outer membrane lipoprotein-sorting protein